MERPILTGALQPGPECLPLEQLGRYADGALPSAEQEAAAAHLQACLTCRSELVLLRAFSTDRLADEEQEAVRAAVADLRRRPPATSDRPAPSAARRRIVVALWRATLPAAAVVLAAAGSYYLFAPTAPHLPADTGPGPEATRSLTVVVRGPSGDQASPPERLEWSPVSGALGYHVRLMEVDRHELWSADTAGPGADLPARVRAQMAPGKTLLWQVTAYGPGQSPLAESDVQRFRVLPQP